MESSPILLPVVVLVAWSVLVMLWLVVTRFAAMNRKGISIKGAVGTRTGSLDGVLDDQAQWKAHNYNNLMEQPTIFYAVALTLALIGEGGGLNETLAWAYVGLRIVHSLVQVTVNVVLYRFLVFTLASVALIWLTVNALAALLG